MTGSKAGLNQNPQSASYLPLTLVVVRISDQTLKYSFSETSVIKLSIRKWKMK